jgi:hypothetical protein
MWQSKKFIVAVVVACLALAGGIGGAVLADDNGDDSGPGALFGTLWDKAREIYTDKTGDDIDLEALKDALTQARSEMQAEALENRLQQLIDEGKITQDEADQYRQWLQQRPDMEQFRQQLDQWRQARPEVPAELKEWQESRPDVPFGLDSIGRGRFRGIGGARGW